MYKKVVRVTARIESAQWVSRHTCAHLDVIGGRLTTYYTRAWKVPKSKSPITINPSEHIVVWIILNSYIFPKSNFDFGSNILYSSVALTMT